MLDAAQQMHLLLYAETVDLLLQRFALGTVADDEQLIARLPLEVAGEIVDHHIDALFFSQTAHEAQRGVAFLDAKLAAHPCDLLGLHILRHKVGQVHRVRHDVDMALHPTAAQVFHHLGGRPDDLGGPARHIAEIEMRAGLDHVLEPLGRYIEHVVVVHGVQRVDHRLFQLAGGKQAEDTHAELGVNVHQIRVEFCDDLETLQVQRVGHAVAVDALERDGRAVQDAVLYVVAGGFGIGGDDQHFVPLGLQTFLQRLDMGDDTADEREIGFGKNGNAHKCSPFLKTSVGPDVPCTARGYEDILL